MQIKHKAGLRHGFNVLIFSCLMMVGCEGLDSIIDDDDGDDGNVTPPAAQQAGEDPAPAAAPTGGPIDLSKVVWLHSNVSGWPETGTLSSVNIGGGSITLNYNKARSWPGVNEAGANVNANPWIFVNQGGTWYAGTWEWLRTGQTTKSSRSVNGDHIKKSPLNGFSPRSGETYGFMVSGLARTSRRNVQERTNIKMVRWP